MASISATSMLGNVRAEEKFVPLEKLPKSVSEAVRKMFPQAEMLKASEEQDEADDDEVVYEVTVKVDGKKIDITVDDEGEIELLEKEIALKDLPKAVSETLARMYSKDTLKSAEAVYELEDGKEELEFYEVQLKNADGKVVEARIKANGKVVQEDDKEDESGENEEKE
ncbi:MAG: hypothetical protein R3C17_13240 [Planctomycetaceae bacterium]